MLQNTLIGKEDDEKNYARKSAASKLDILIKKTIYIIENVSL